MSKKSMIRDNKTEIKYERNDWGNAKRLADHCGKDMRFCAEEKAWYAWNGKRWESEADALNIIRRKAIDVVKMMLDETEKIDSEDERKKALQHATSSGNASKITSMIKVAELCDGVPIAADRLDSGKLLLNCANGTLDLSACELKTHDKDDFITKIIATEYDHEAKCERWESILNDIFGGNESLIKYFQRVIGYSLTGLTSEQCFFILHGNGNNGKTTLMKTIANLMGDLAKQAPPKAFMKKRNDNGAGYDIAILKGARLVQAVETEHGQELAENLIKSVTGGDQISSRDLYKSFTAMNPTFKIFILTNHLPVIKGTDDGIWRRVRLVPFNNSIPADKVDKNLINELKGEYAGILAWAVEGCRQWQSGGLQEPAEVLEATAHYHAVQDPIGEFIKQKCKLGDNLKERSTVLMKAYNDFSGESLSTKAFVPQLISRGFEKAHEATFRYIRGLQLKAIAGH
jgi:putative DNA primase/helicase